MRRYTLTHVGENKWIIWDRVEKDHLSTRMGTVMHGELGIMRQIAERLEKGGEIDGGVS